MAEKNFDFVPVTFYTGNATEPSRRIDAADTAGENLSLYSNNTFRVVDGSWYPNYGVNASRKWMFDGTEWKRLDYAKTILTIGGTQAFSGDGRAATQTVDCVIPFKAPSMHPVNGVQRPYGLFVYCMYSSYDGGTWSMNDTFFEVSEDGGTTWTPMPQIYGNWGNINLDPVRTNGKTWGLDGLTGDALKIRYNNPTAGVQFVTFGAFVVPNASTIATSVQFPYITATQTGGNWTQNLSAQIGSGYRVWEVAMFHTLVDAPSTFQMNRDISEIRGEGIRTNLNHSGSGRAFIRSCQWENWGAQTVENWEWSGNTNVTQWTKAVVIFNVAAQQTDT